MLIGRDKYYKILYFKINITGRRGSDYESDFALDDFKIYKEHCSKYNFSYCSVYNHIIGFKLIFLFKLNGIQVFLRSFLYYCNYA